MVEESHADPSWFGVTFERIRQFLLKCTRDEEPSSDAELLQNISVLIRQGVVDERPNNSVSTTKYTWYNFVPLATALQFRRFGNMFYLFVVVIYAVGYFAPTVFQSSSQPFGTLGVLLFVLAVTLIFEAKDDLQRYRGDRQSNSQHCTRVLKNGDLQKTTWGDLVPGEVIRVEKGEHIPADILIIDSSEENGICYIETSGIDGETNLKIRKTSRKFRDLGVTGSNISGSLDCEEPNVFLQFSGRVVVRDTPVSVGFDSMILRGSQLKNTHWIDGLVVYAGKETKLIMSANHTPSKFSRVDVLLNRILGYTFTIYLVLVIFFMFLIVFWVPNTNTYWYFQGLDVVNSYILPGWLAYLFTYAGMLAALIPINIYVCVEVMNFVQSVYIDCDLNMYDPKSDTPAHCRTTSLVAEIGQVTHVFTDKTGTLTNNEMRLVSLSVGGFMYGFKPRKIPNSYSGNSTIEIEVVHEMAQPPKVPIKDLFPDFPVESNSSLHLMMKILSVCHTVIIDYDADGKLNYNAEGPDEEALVNGAAELGARLVSTEDGMFRMIFDHNPEVVEEFQILAVNKFTSDRKRMSVVVHETRTNSYWVYVKGADNIVLDLCTPESRDSAASTLEDVEAYSLAGLRTLLLASRQLTKAEFDSWSNQYETAKLSLGEVREKELSDAAAVVEKDLVVVGATAIEDALQEGVPETIKAIRDAHIMLWVLTGDKIETAINIAFSASIIDSSMSRILIDGDDPASLIEDIRLNISQLSRVSAEARTDASTEEDSNEFSCLLGADLINASVLSSNLALVVSGQALNVLLADEKGTFESQQQLLRLANMCSVVIACRVSPKEKALVVRMVRRGFNVSKRKQPVVLAIGDGANDVPMIQEAKVGVGISGHEGLQAVNNSDFSIARFRFLKELLLVHGRWNYQRSANMIKYSMYSWYVYTFPTMAFLFYCMVSGQLVVYNTYYPTVYAFQANALITAIAWFQIDIKRETALMFPSSYSIGRLNQYFNGKSLLSGILRSVFHSAILMMCAFYTTGPAISFAYFGATMYTSMFAVVFTRQMLLAMTWNWLLLLFTVLLLGCFWLSIYVCDVVLGFEGESFALSSDSGPLYQRAVFSAFTVVCFDYAFYGIGKLLYPDKNRLLREVDRYAGRRRLTEFSPPNKTQQNANSSIRKLLRQISETGGNIGSLRDHKSFVGPV